MSRRFGRKQRREARSMIAARDETIWHARQALLREGIRSGELARKAEFLLDRIRLWDDEIRALLGPYTSFAIDDTTFRVDHPFSYHIETMLGFMCGLDERDLERLRRLLTVRVMVGGDYPRAQAYYALSEQTWNELKRAGPDGPGVNRLIHRVASDLVRLLAAPPKKPERAARPDMRKPTGHSRDWTR